MRKDKREDKGVKQEMKKTWHGSEFALLYTNMNGSIDIDQEDYRICQIETTGATDKNGRPILLAEIVKRED